MNGFLNCFFLVLNGNTKVGSNSFDQQCFPDHLWSNEFDPASVNYELYLGKSS